MLKRIIAFLTLIVLIAGLVGCQGSIKDTVEGKEATLPPMRIDSSLVCSVKAVIGNRITAEILEGNSNYDQGDTIYITYEEVTKDQEVKIATVLSLTYNYVTDVAAIDGTPHIMAKEITVVKDYKPSVNNAE